MSQQYPQAVETFSHELIAGPTGWQSIPSAVRFAVWVWAVSVILGVIGAAIGAVIWFIVLGSALGQM